MVCPNCAVDIEKFEREQKLRREFEKTYGQQLSPYRILARLAIAATGLVLGFLFVLMGNYPELTIQQTLKLIISRFQNPGGYSFLEHFRLILIWLVCSLLGGVVTSRFFRMLCIPRNEKRLWEQFQTLNNPTGS